MPPDTTCSTCRFWDRGAYASRVNECRCHAPTLITVDRHAEWPLTRAEEWCGEWRDRPVVEPAQDAPSYAAPAASTDASADERTALRAALEAAGVKVDGRWSVARMRDELSKVNPNG